MSGETTNPNGSSKKELRQVKESPEEIRRRISEAGYGSIAIGRAVATHAIQFEVSEDREIVGEDNERKAGLSEFMRAGNPTSKQFNPDELSDPNRSMEGKVQKQSDKNKRKTTPKTEKKVEDSKTTVDRDDK